MLIISNPPFHLCGIKKKAMKAMFDRADDYVVLATWRFCNNTLEQQELVMPEEWPEILAQTMAISVKHLPRNKEKMPDFYLEKTSEYKEGFYVNINTHYIDISNKVAYKWLKLDDFTEESFIRKASGKISGHYFAKGERKKYVWTVPKKDYSEYEEQIFIDTLKWANTMMRFPLIRKEFTL